jgi:glutamine amidotransferase
MILIVDYGVGNIASLVNMFDHVGVVAEATSDPDRIALADRLVLPGVGAFDKAMRELDERRLIAPIRAAALGREVPTIGVCLGMQLLARGSEEGRLPGLGLIAADVVRIPAGAGVKVPHVGWAELDLAGASPLFRGAGANERFYFVHSYHVACDEPEDVAATIDYGGTLCVAVSRGNIHGVQFHPEKSHRFGMRLLRAFAELG